MAWDNTENLLFVHKKSCRCTGDMVMVYEPFKHKNGARICGCVCVDCGNVISMDSQQPFGFYTGKNKKDVWDLDRMDIRDFHPIARRIIQDMKGGRYFTYSQQAGAVDNNQRSSAEADRRRSESQAQCGQKNARKTGSQQYSQQSNQQKTQRKTQHNNYNLSKQYQQPTYAQQIQPREHNEIKSDGKDHDVYRSYIYVSDMDFLYQSKQYQRLISLYEGKLQAGFSLDRNELFRYAYSMGELERYRDAINMYSEYITRYPKSTDITTVYNNRAIAYSRLGMEYLAIQDYKQAIAFGHPNSNGLRELVLAKEQELKLEEAIKLYNASAYKEALLIFEECRTKGIALNANWFRYAYCQQELKQDSKALFAYKEYLKLYPNSANAYHNIAGIYWRSGLYEKALENYEKAWNYYNDANKQRHNFIKKRMDIISTLFHAEEAYRNNDYSSAVQGYEEFNKQKDLGIYWGSYAYSLLSINRYSEAEIALTNYMKQNPSSNTYEIRGWVRIRLDKYELAFEDLWKGYHLCTEEKDIISILSKLTLAAEVSNNTERYREVLKELRHRNLADEYDAGLFFKENKAYLDAIHCFSLVEGLDSSKELIYCKIMNAVSKGHYEEAHQLMLEHKSDIDDETREQIMNNGAFMKKKDVVILRKTDKDDLFYAM